MITPRTYLSLSAALACALVASRAHAHITLKKPAAWVKETALGGPQKGGPCGPGGADNVDPIPTTGAITTFEAGETIDVEWTETIAHPGHFRIALAEDRSELKDPQLELDGSCNYDEAKLVTTPHDNVLADGVSMRSRMGMLAGSSKAFSAKVTLPDKPCEKCTLQVLQFMENHPPPCIYYHCADIKIVPKGSGTTTTSAPASSAGVPAADSGSGAPAKASRAGATSAAAGSGSTPTTKADSGGCSVSAVGRPGPAAAFTLLLLGALLWLARRAYRARSALYGLSAKQ